MYLLIETLNTDDEQYIIGMVELVNAQSHSKEDLIQYAGATSDEIMAVQFLNPLLIAGPIHILSAAQNALNAWLGGYPISRSLGVEILVHSSGQRQIARGLESHGVTDDMTHLGLVVIGRDRTTVSALISKTIEYVGEEAEHVFQVDAERFALIQTHYEIGQEELSLLHKSASTSERYQALGEAVVSRVSLVALDT